MGGIMTESLSQFQKTTNQQYNFDDHSPAPDTISDNGRVLVPPDPPSFGPAAARALLSLLLAVHRKRGHATEPPGEVP
jgi:hypothetical protein